MGTQRTEIRKCSKRSEEDCDNETKIDWGVLPTRIVAMLGNVRDGCFKNSEASRTLCHCQRIITRHRERQTRHPLLRLLGNSKTSRDRMVVSIDRWIGKVAVVTGASAGIGAAIAEQLVEAGLQVVGLARRSERVEELAKKLSGKKGKLYAFKTDISKEEDVVNAFKWIRSNVGPVSILINNAGIAQNTDLIDGDVTKWKKILDTNVLGLCIATREAITSMKANKIDGHIVHINGIAGHSVPNFPKLNVGAASKHAVTALTETLRQELNRIGSKIRITSVSPGAVKTEIGQGEGFDFPPEFFNMPILEAEDVADAVTYVLSSPPHVQIHELIIKPVGGFL